jgi:PAS domain S-box-containing protein
MASQNGFAKFSTANGYERLEDFLDNATVGIHLVDKEGIILYANKAELKMLGYSSDEYIGHNITEFHAQQFTIDSIFSKLLRNEQLNNHEATLRCKDGSIKDVVINSNVYFEKNKFKHTRCFTRDITNNKRVENLLRFLNKAGEELTATHNTQEAIDKIIKLIVPNFADWFIMNELRDDGFAHLVKMAHVDPAKVLWAEKYRRTHPIDFNDPVVGSLGWVMRTGEPLLVADTTDEILEAGAKDVEQLEILKAFNVRSVMMIPIQIKGKVTGVVSFMSCNHLNKYDENDFNFAKDFTNRIALTLENARLYEEVQKDIQQRIEADKKKDEFISIASHELKTPVTSLKAYTQILQMTFDEERNHSASDLLSKMNKQVDKLTGLIVDLLDITKIDKGEMVFDFEDFDFNDLAKEIAEEMQRTTDKHTLKLQLSGEAKIKGDRNRLSQVLINFISNAIKYSPRADEIIITSAFNNTTLKVCVHDFGIGIPKEEQSKIFKRFYRVSGKNNHTFPGLGLGLYISSEIIKRHSGKIYFESVEGKGSKFCFEISSPGYLSCTPPS